MTVLEFVGEVPGTTQEVFRWHENPGAFDRLPPPWESIEVLQAVDSLRNGSKGVLRMKVGPIPITWKTEHTDYTPPSLFVDKQTQGPFKSWTHYHHFEPLSDTTTKILDEIHYEAPLSFFSNTFVQKKLHRLFRYRHQQCRIDLQRHQEFASKPKLRIAITGASGLVGKQLVCFLSTGGHEILQLVRRPALAANEISWNPDEATLEADKLEGVDAVIHLAGANVGASRWTKSRKELLRSSRINSTSLLATTLSKLKNPPKTFISMSGSGHYGYQDYDTAFNESHPPADDFLARLTVDWEANTAPASDAGIRTVMFRTPVVLTARGGALTKMLPPFLMGAGGKIGSGKQPMSWIALDDLLGIFLFALHKESLSGPLNIGASHIPTNLEFTKTLGKVLKRPTIAPLPAFVVKTLFGEMGESLLLGGQKLDSSRLLDSGFKFAWPDLEVTLRHELGLSHDSPHST